MSNDIYSAHSFSYHTRSSVDTRQCSVVRGLHTVFPYSHDATEKSAVHSCCVVYCMYVVRTHIHTHTEYSRRNSSFPLPWGTCQVPLCGVDDCSARYHSSVILKQPVLDILYSARFLVYTQWCSLIALAWERMLKRGAIYPSKTCKRVPRWYLRSYKYLCTDYSIRIHTRTHTEHKWDGRPGFSRA